MYVKKDALPTTADYDYRPYLPGSDETVTVDSPAAGTWFIMLRGYSAYSAVTLEATYVPVPEEITELENGVPVTGLSGAAASETFYKIKVPAGQAKLQISMAGGTGDADLYVRKDEKPTQTEWDYRPYAIGNDETVTVDNPAAGTWFIMIRGYSAYSGVTLEATYVPVPEQVTELENGVPVPGLSGASGSETFYKIEVPAGQATLEISIAGGTGDADLYVRKGQKPTSTEYDYRPYLVGNNETVTVDNPAADTWFVMIRGYSAYSGVTLEATYLPVPEEITELANGVPVPGLSGAAGSEKFYKIKVPAGQTTLEIALSGGTGDADLYVRKDEKPTTSEWDYRPYLVGNNETVTIDNPAAGTWFIMIRGYSAYTGATIQATYSAAPAPVTELANGVPVPGLSGAAGSEKFYKIKVPAGQARLEISISGGIGDADLYVRKDVQPTVTQWDYRPYLAGNNETVTIDNPPAATWFIMIRGRSAYTGVTLLATYRSGPVPVVELANGVPVPGLAGAVSSERFYKIVVPTGQDFLNIQISGGTGDCDLYVRKGAQPTPTSWDYRPYLVGNNETVQIPSPAAATWYIMLKARQAYSGVTLVASYGITGAGNHFASDPDCVALWRFEDGALTRDSIGSNTLVNNGVRASTSAYKEGSASGDFEANQSDWMSVDDDDLSSNFPTRSGDSQVEMSICFWMKVESFAWENTIISKYLIATDARSWRIFVSNTLTGGELKVGLGRSGGSNFNTYVFDAPDQELSTNRWYHVAFTYRDSDRGYRVRVWDDTAGALRIDATGTANYRMSVTDAPVILGDLPLEARYYDGLLDEVVVFKDVLTSAEIDQVRQGIYGTP